MINPIFENYLKKNNLYSDELLEKIANNNGSCKGIEEIPEKDQATFITTMDISAEDHTEILGIIQEYVDLSVSKTVNAPQSATIEDIMHIYMQAWKVGAKGITVYRDGSRANQTLSSNREVKEEINKLKRGNWAPIAEDTTYFKRKVYIGCGKVTLFIGWSPSENKIQEFWVKRSGQGGCEKNLENMTIAMSGMMRLGGTIYNLDKAFDGVGGCNSFVAARGKGQELSKGNNCGNAVLYEIKEFLKEMGSKEVSKIKIPIAKPAMIKINKFPSEELLKTADKELAESKSKDNHMKCPECGEPLGPNAHEGGCISCKACGWTRC